MTHAPSSVSPSDSSSRNPEGRPLDVEALRAARRGARFGHALHYFTTVGSTNDRAKELAQGDADEGTTVIAEQQTKGRGRLGRTWVSPPFRNLYLSIVLRPPLATTQAPQIGLLMGLVVAETARVWVADAAIKWPNDVVIGGRKVAGMLAEMEAVEGSVRFVIAGIGVNLNSVPEDFPDELRNKVSGLGSASGAAIDRVAFTNRLLSQFEERYDAFLRHGFAAVRSSWEQLSCLTGRRVCIEDGGQRHEGIVAGMADDGTLRLVDATQHEHAIVAGDVTVIEGYAGPKIS